MKHPKVNFSTVKLGAFCWCLAGFILAAVGQKLLFERGISSVDGSLAGAIQHHANFAAMPPSGPMLSQCRIDQVLNWIQSGAPNN